jgi:hypothetical protein
MTLSAVTRTRKIVDIGCGDGCRHPHSHPHPIFHNFQNPHPLPHPISKYFECFNFLFLFKNSF